jgi:AcrR family transcriptional regulator
VEKVELKPDDKRARLLDAALELFEGRGFGGVAVPEIAVRAGVATGTVYRYFASKEALVNALYQHWKGAYNASVLAPLPRGLTVRDSFTEYWQRITDFARAHPRAVRFLDLHHHGEYLDEASRAADRTFYETVEAFLIQARAARAIRDISPALVVALVWGAAAGLAKFAAQGTIDLSTETAADMEEALWRGIAKA